MKELKIAVLVSAMAVMSLAATASSAAALAPMEQEPVKQDKIELVLQDLPETVQEDVKLNHESAKFVTAYKITGEDGAIKYKVLLNDDGKELKLFYNSEGEILE